MSHDAVLHDLRRYEDACDRADQEASRIDEEVSMLTSKGSSHYPFDDSNVEAFLALGVDYPEQIAQLMEAGDDCEVGRLIREWCVKYWNDAARDLVQ